MTVATGWDPASRPTLVSGALDESLTTVTPAGVTFPVGGVASPAFSTGENPVHPWRLGRTTARRIRRNLPEGVVMEFDSVAMSRSKM
jgi:hypothetical protein